MLHPTAWGLPRQVIWGVGVLFTLCVLIRLARFNVETTEDDTHEGFEGLPSPAAAGMLASIAIALPELKAVAIGDYHPAILWVAQSTLAFAHFLVPALALALAYLMVSRYQYPHVFQRWVRGRRSLHQIGQALFVVFGIVLVLLVGTPAGAGLLCVFVSSSQHHQRPNASANKSGNDRRRIERQPKNIQGGPSCG